MTQSLVERELKFDVEPGFVVPDLEPALPPGGRIEAASEHLRSDYFDTADQALLRARMTLRRRTGSDDVGWQLKIPHGAFREEIRTELDGRDVPEELRRLLVGVIGRRPLIQIASVLTERSVFRLVDAEGRLLAEVDDDSVHASAPGDGAAVVSAWREVEVELGQVDVELLYALGRRLRRAGARRSDSASKLVRALPAMPAKPGAQVKRSALRAGDVVAGYLAEQYQVMLAGDLALRRGDDSVIHKTRVATRRFRSAVRVFGAVLQPEPARALDVELRWYAGLLGEVRDRQVLRQRLERMASDVDDTLLLGPVKARIDTELRREQREHWDRLLEELTGERYLALLEAAADFVREPPFAAAAHRRASCLSSRVRRAEQKLARTLKRAIATGDAQQLHAARKAAKRARYATEAAGSVLGTRHAATRAKRYQRLQDLLGEHQDSLVSSELLRRLGATAGTIDGENGFAFGILHEREQRNARIARKKARKAAARWS